MDLNQITITGTLERDPVHRSGDTTPSVGFTLRVVEVNQSGQEFTLYVPCEAYGHASGAAEHVHAGDNVMVHGKLKWSSWTGKDGHKKTSLAVLARLVRQLV